METTILNDVPSRLGHQHAESSFLQRLGFHPKSSGLLSRIKVVPDQQRSTIVEGEPQMQSLYTSEHGTKQEPDRKPDIEVGHFNASDLTTFLSRIKYLNSEIDATDLGPLPAANSSTFADQKAVITAQAARVRNQLELKFNTISLMAHDRPGDVTGNNGFVGSAEHRMHYNPLQTIRDRGKRPPAMSVTSKKDLVWYISVSEQVKDFSWRHRTAKARARKQRVKRMASSEKSLDKGAFPLPEQLGSGLSIYDDAETAFCASTSSVSVSDTGANSVDSAGTSAGPGASAGVSSGTSTGTGTGTGGTGTGASTLAPAARPPLQRRRSSRLSKSRSRSTNRHPSMVFGSDDPAYKLPQSDCELIARLRVAHNDADQDSDEYALSRVSTGNSDNEVDREQRSSESRASSKARFCRSSANVADTWNRMYTSSKHSSSTTDEDDSWLPRKESVPSVPSSPHHSAEELVPAPPVLKLTSDSGKEQVIDSGKKSNTAMSVSSNSRSSRMSHSRRRSEMSFKFKLPAEMVDPIPSQNPQNTTASSSAVVPNSLYTSTSSDLVDPVRTFGSLRPSVLESRRDPWERTMITLESELLFLIPFYDIALRRYEPQAQCDKMVSKLKQILESDNTAALCDNLKLEDVPSYLRYLSRIEQETVSKQQQLDSEIAASLDNLRGSTDLMVSEVNTTLSRRIRSLTSRMEKQCNTHECSMVLTAGYSAIEYSIPCAMWTIWVGVKIWKIVLFLVSILSFVCNIFVIA